MLVGEEKMRYLGVDVDKNLTCMERSSAQDQCKLLEQSGQTQQLG